MNIHVRDQSNQSTDSTFGHWASINRAADRHNDNYLAIVDYLVNDVHFYVDFVLTLEENCVKFRIRQKKKIINDCFM